MPQCDKKIRERLLNSEIRDLMSEIIRFDRPKTKNPSPIGEGSLHF